MSNGAVTASELRRVQPDQLTPHPKNSRTHRPEQIEELRLSIKRFGVVRPVICDEELMVLAGHGLLEAALAEGLDELPALVVSGLNDDEKRAYLIADNRLAEKSRWDWDKLAVELGDLMPVVDLADLGFKEWEYESIPRAGHGNSEVDLDDLETEHECPRCGYEF